MDKQLTDLGRYQLRCELARGGMAAVHYGLAKGARGFSRPVAIKRMLPEIANDDDARKMILDEARLASRIQHPNVVQIIDVVENEGEVFLVMEYVHGPALQKLIVAASRAKKPIPLAIASAVISGVLRGLEAAHRAVDEEGRSLEIVHRDISPSNILLDIAGQPRVLDFGVARAQGRLRQTTDGRVFGKMGYLAPEQVHGRTSVRSDIFSTAVVLWEMLAAVRLFKAENDAQALADTLMCKVPPLLGIRADISPQLQTVVDRALARDPAQRFQTAQEFCDALVTAQPPASPDQVALWVREMGATFLAERKELLDRSAATGEGSGSYPVKAPDSSKPADASTVATSPARPGFTARLVGAAAAALMLVLLAAAALRWAISSPTPQPQPIARPAEPPVADLRPAPSPANPGALPTVAEPKPALPSVAESAPSEPNTVNPTNPAPVPTPPQGPTAKTPPRMRPTVKRPPVAAPKPNCDPPYFLDASGYKRFKPECF